MSTVPAVVSPAGKIHAVRPGSPATACGLDYRKRSRRGRNTYRGWVPTESVFQVFVERQQVVCLNCIENLALGTGPGVP